MFKARTYIDETPPVLSSGGASRQVGFVLPWPANSNQENKETAGHSFFIHPLPLSKSFSMGKKGRNIPHTHGYKERRERAERR